MSDNKHITYLFGAGTSYAAMPVVSEINQDILLMDLAVRENPRAIGALQPFSNWLQGFSENLPEFLKVESVANVIIGEANRFQSIDTYAKWLFHTKQDEKLDALRILVNAYFCIRHYLSAPYETIKQATLNNHYGGTAEQKFRATWENDMRFDSLYASLLRGTESNLPDDVSFLTWNYDLLFEYAHARFQDPGEHPMKSKTLGSAPIMHLNGHASIVNPDDLLLETFDGGTGTYTAINPTFFDFENHSTSIQYAWEMTQEQKQQLKSTLTKTTHLVVIGYSFPVFNREIDRQILAATNLRKIYIQDLPEALPGIENRVRALLGNRVKPQTQINPITKIGKEPIHIETINTVDQFHIPFELI
jgi:hypothetical protein